VIPARLVLATANPGKVEELRAAVAEWGSVHVLSLDAFPGVACPEENDTSYVENAVLKARAVAAATAVPALGDDSGLEVDALGGAPGPRSARYAGEDANDEQNLSKLIAALADVPAALRTARYRCVAVLVAPNGETDVAEGTVEGLLIDEPRGSGGFGYDPIFVPVGESRTMAELAPDEKDTISHRGRAFRALVPALARLGG
jgi:XTP/dITP diphosphohydrolase